MTFDLAMMEMETTVSAGEEDMRQYLNEIRRYPRLTAQQERELAKRCAQGDEAAIRQMVNSNLRLVVSVAREYAGQGVPLMDLVQEGSIGLLAAAKKYDAELEFRFSTYATKWIRQGVTKSILNHGGLIRVPAHTAERIRKVEAVRRSLALKNGCEPTPEQISENSDIPAAKVRQLLQFSPEICSLDTPVGEESDPLGILLEDIQAPQPYEELVRDELGRTMDELLGTLNDRQQQVLRMHYGMVDGVCHSFEEIGAQLGVSKERARQIEKQAMASLQKTGADMGLEDFLNE